MLRELGDGSGIQDGHGETNNVIRTSLVSQRGLASNWIYGPVSHSGRTYTVKIQDARSTLFSRLELYTQVKLRILVLKQTQHK